MNPPSACPQPTSLESAEISFKPASRSHCPDSQPRVHPLGILGDLGESGDAPSTDAADAEQMICCGFTELL